MPYQFNNVATCPLFTVVVAEPADGDSDVFTIRGETVDADTVKSPNVSIQVSGSSTINYPARAITQDVVGFNHINLITGVKQHQRTGDAVSTAVADLVYCCITANQGSLDYDALQGQGVMQFDALQADTFIVVVDGRVDIGGVILDRWGIGHRANPGQIDMNLLDPDTKVFLVWERI